MTDRYTPPLMELSHNIVSALFREIVTGRRIEEMSKLTPAQMGKKYRLTDREADYLVKLIAVSATV